MCPHQWRRINDVFVCMRCGITRIEGTKKIIFDRKITNYKPKGKKRGKK